MLEKLTVDFGKPIPLFPLPGCVLLPHGTIPLRIFEHKYKCMVRDILDSHGLIAMAFFEDTNWDRDDSSCPPLRPFVCVGYAVRHERLPNGRYQVLLQGICRAVIKKEVDHSPYRAAFLEPIESSFPKEMELREYRNQLESLLSDRLLKQLASVSAIHNWLSAEIPTPTLIDLAIMTLCYSVEQRYAMLAEQDIFARAGWLKNMLQDTRRTLVIAERFRREVPVDGVYLN